jgi:hypothetical protein
MIRGDKTNIIILTIFPDSITTKVQNGIVELRRLTNLKSIFLVCVGLRDTIIVAKVFFIQFRGFKMTNNQENLSQENQIYTVLSIGQRGAGKTVFL